jgi:hypothetical protein
MNGTRSSSTTRWEENDLVVVEFGEPAVLERGVTHPQSTLRGAGQLLEALRAIATVVARAPPITTREASRGSSQSTAADQTTSLGGSLV